MSSSCFGDTQETRLGLVQDSINKASNAYGTSVKAEDVALTGDTPLEYRFREASGLWRCCCWYWNLFDRAISAMGTGRSMRDVAAS